jgi:outer membrane protein assembly factor BamB
MLPTSLFITAALCGPAADIKPGDWPQFRGPDRDGASKETGLLQQWPQGGPKKLWTVSGCGEGFGTVAIAGGFIYGAGQKDGKECVWCRKEADGSEVWNAPFASEYDERRGNGTRSTPTVAGDKVYCVAPGGDLVCLAAKDGKEVWKKSYVKDFGGKVQTWGYSESVLVDGDQVIGTPCSNKAAVVAFNKDTGAVLWQTEVPNAGGSGGYSSAAKMTVGKTDTYVTLLGKAGGVVGVDAKTGKLLWQYTKIMNGTANIPTPVVKGDLVWCSTGYGDGGSALLHVKESGGKFTAEELKYYKANELQNHHGGMVLVGDHVFLGHAHNNGWPACVELKTGEIKWKESRGAAGGGGSGSVVYADGMLYFRYENGTMALVKADPEKFEVKGSFKIPEPSGKASWQHPVVAHGKLYLRDQDKLHCFDVKKGS